MHRFKITQFDVDHVIKHIQKHGKITKNDIVPGWAQIEPEKFKTGGSKLLHGEKQVIPVENGEKLLRDMMFDKKADIPLSRDSGASTKWRSQIAVAPPREYVYEYSGPNEKLITSTRAAAQ